MTACTRPLLRWLGGKWRLAPWIISHFPTHRVYVEPFGGAGSVLIRKPRAYAEIWNDLDSSVVNLFRVLRTPDQAARLIELLRLTPFARAEFEAAYEPSGDPVEAARRLVVVAFMGFGSNAANLRSTGFRANSNRSGTTPAGDWANYPDALTAIVERLAGVVVENRDAMQVMAQHDSPDTLHYVDPPYVWSTRNRGGGGHHPKWRGYAVELTDEQHRELLACLRGLRGLVALSGYPHSIYDDALHDWRRAERADYADGARPRTEVLWLNPRCAQALAAQPLPLHLPPLDAARFVTTPDVLPGFATQSYAPHRGSDK